MYAIETLVLFDRRGVYKISGVGESPVPAGDGCLYYKLQSIFSTSNETIYIPVNTTAFMRPLISEEDAADYLELSSRIEPQVFASRKASDLIAHYRELLASNQMENCLLLIKEIYTRQKDMTRQGKKLGQVDQQYLKLAERLVCEEFAVVLHSTPEAVKKSLYAAMKRKPVTQNAVC